MSERKSNTQRRARRKTGQKGRKGKDHKVATRVAGPNVLSTLLHTQPIFPVRTRRSGMLYYEQDLKLSHATGAKQDYFYIANGMYDPNQTGTGHQPMGFDQMMLFYEQFIVVRAKILVQFLNTGQSPAFVGVYLSPDSVASTDVNKAVENGLIKIKLIDDVAASGGTGEKSCRMELDVDVAKYFGRKSEQDCLDDSTLTGNSTADPSEGVYFALTSWGFPQGNSTTVYAAVTIAYDAWFTEPRKVASS